MTNIYVMQSFGIISIGKTNDQVVLKSNTCYLPLAHLKCNQWQCIIQSIQQILLIPFLSLDTISCAGKYQSFIQQDHLRMNDSTGSRSIDRFRSMINLNNRSKVRDVNPPSPSDSQLVRNSQNVVNIQSECSQSVAGMQPQ